MDMELSLMSGYRPTYGRPNAHTTKLQGVPVILGGGTVAIDDEVAVWIGEHDITGISCNR